MSPEDERTVLRYNFDEGSKGDSDHRTLDTRLVQARKQHTCFPCLGQIEIGERHRVERTLYDGKVGNCRTCATCMQAMLKEYKNGNWQAMEARYTLGRSRSEQQKERT